MWSESGECHNVNILCVMVRNQGWAKVPPDLSSKLGSIEKCNLNNALMHRDQKPLKI